MNAVAMAALTRGLVQGGQRGVSASRLSVRKMLGFNDARRNHGHTAPAATRRRRPPRAGGDGTHTTKVHADSTPLSEAETPQLARHNLLYHRLRGDSVL